MTIVNADDVATFRTEVLESDVPVLVDFWAEWCGPCRMVGPELEALSEQYGDTVKVVKVNVDLNGSVAQEYGVMSIPMIGLFERGDMTTAMVGARPRDAIADALGLARFTAPAPTRAAVDEATPKVEVGDDGRY